jgi:hypothetical protein
MSKRRDEPESAVGRQAARSPCHSSLNDAILFTAIENE